MQCRLTGRRCWARRRICAASFFAESEHAQALGKLKEVEPEFNAEAFITDLTEYIIPEVVEAFWKNDKQTLQLWCTEAVRCRGAHMRRLRKRGH